MSNESENKNKRIDLKQFEGMTEGPWDMHYDDSALEDQEYLEHGAQLTPVGTLNEMARVDAHAIGKVPELIAELKRCYEEIDEMQGKVPYVEHCEVCGASDGEQTEGCGDCGIIHYQTSRGLIALHGYTWGFFHKDSPLWEKYQ